jgi:hypothetical protein
VKYIPCKQGEPLWYQSRAGKITASRFADAISVLSRKSGDKTAGDPTDASDKYASEVAIERIAGTFWGEPIKPWVLERGHRLEPLARQAYERKTGNIAEEAGVCLTDDEVFGYSTDGMVSPQFEPREWGQFLLGCEGLIEIKCPIDALKVLTIWRDGDVSEYFEQMQGGMWITGARWCDLVMYVPELEASGHDVYVQRVHRDETFIDAMVQRLLEFQVRVDRYAALLGAQQPANEAQWPLPKAA